MVVLAVAEEAVAALESEALGHADGDALSAGEKESARLAEGDACALGETVVPTLPELSRVENAEG